MLRRRRATRSAPRLLIASAKRVLAPTTITARFRARRATRRLPQGSQEFGVTFDSWFSEKSLFDSGWWCAQSSNFSKRGTLPEDGADGFRSTVFGRRKGPRGPARQRQFHLLSRPTSPNHPQQVSAWLRTAASTSGVPTYTVYIARVKGALAGVEALPAQLTIALVQFAYSTVTARKSRCPHGAANS